MKFEEQQVLNIDSKVRIMDCWTWQSSRTLEWNVNKSRGWPRTKYWEFTTEATVEEEDLQTETLLP